MNKHHPYSAALPVSMLSLALLAACSSMPADNPRLAEAHSDYRAAQANSDTREYAAPELKLAGEALARADNARDHDDGKLEVDHLAYLAKQDTAMAVQVGQQRASEHALAAATVERDKIRLAARTQEADAATQAAEAAKAQAAESMREAANSQARADATQAAADDAQARNAALEAALRDLDAKQTDRGMVITISDVLFDTNRAELKSGGLHNIEKLSNFLKQYPERKVRIEGYTDSTGSVATNLDLSSRRADSVRNALVDMGISDDRIKVRGYGEDMPVASNDTASGRQMNRRVEIVLSDRHGEMSASR